MNPTTSIRGTATTTDDHLTGTVLDTKQSHTSLTSVVQAVVVAEVVVSIETVITNQEVRTRMILHMDHRSQARGHSKMRRVLIKVDVEVRERLLILVIHHAMLD